MVLYIWRDPNLREQARALMDARYEIRFRMSRPSLDVDPDLENLVESVFGEMLCRLRVRDAIKQLDPQQEDDNA